MIKTKRRRRRDFARVRIDAESWAFGTGLRFVKIGVRNLRRDARLPGPRRQLARGSDRHLALRATSLAHAKRMPRHGAARIAFAGKRTGGVRLRVLLPPATKVPIPKKPAPTKPWSEQEGDPGFDPDAVKDFEPTV